MLDDEYIQLINDVVAVNYYGELLTVELLSGLLRQSKAPYYRDILARQLMDETRHANVTRELLLKRGRDPIREDSVVEFTYHHLFREWSKLDFEEVLACLGANERSSSRNFATLIKVGNEAGDRELAAIYSEILNDESNHAHHIFAALPDTPVIRGVAERATAAMHACFNLRYARLRLVYPAAFGR